MGTLRLMGDVSGFIDIKSGDAPASGTLTLPPSGGANNQVLSSNGANKQVWTSPSALEGFRGIVRSHPDSNVVNSKIHTALTEVVFSNGRRFIPGTGLVFDKAVTGSINGMQAAAANSTWNKLYYLRKSSDGSEGLWGLRAKNYLNDVSFVTATNAVRNLRLLTGTATDKLAQGVQFATSGKHEIAEFEVIRVGAVVGNIWWSLQASSGGDATGTELARTDKYDASRIPTTALKIRIPFRTPFSQTLATQYHWVMEGDYAKSDTIFIGWRGVAAGGYANGIAREYNGTVWANASGVGDFNFIGYVTQNDTALSLPAGYDQSVQIGWFFIAGSGNIVPFTAQDRSVEYQPQQFIGTTASATPLLFDLSAFFPPQLTTLSCWVTSNLGSAAVDVGSVPRGFGVTVVDGNEVPDEGFTATIPIASTRPQVPGSLKTEYGGAYLTAKGGGTARLQISGFTW